MKSLNHTAAVVVSETTPKKKQKVIEIGTIVSTHAHPYCADADDIVIAAYSYLTPPLMVVVEIKKGAEYDEDTGIKNDDSFNCLYYSGRDGKFIHHWFRGRELKVIQSTNKTITYKAFKGEQDTFKGCLGRSIVLKTVDLELAKTKTWTETTEGTIKWKENNLLDYLPPLGTIIGIRKLENQDRFSKKSGKLISEKSPWLFKIRWLNNSTSKFSEEELPAEAFKIIESHDLVPLHFQKNFIYIQDLDEPIEFEDSEVKIYRQPISFKQTIWKHYYYLYQFKNILTNSQIIIDREGTARTSKDEAESFQKWFDSNEINFQTNIFVNDTRSDLIEKWFEIHYRDKANRSTSRIIQIRAIHVQDISKERKIAIIEANCLLRNGEIRHFYSNRIDRFREVPAPIQQLFRESVTG